MPAAESRAPPVGRRPRPAGRRLPAAELQPQPAEPRPRPVAPVAPPAELRRSKMAALMSRHRRQMFARTRPCRTSRWIASPPAAKPASPVARAACAAILGPLARRSAWGRERAPFVVRPAAPVVRTTPVPTAAAATGSEPVLAKGIHVQTTLVAATASATLACPLAAPAARSTTPVATTPRATTRSARRVASNARLVPAATLARPAVARMNLVAALGQRPQPAPAPPLIWSVNQQAPVAAERPSPAWPAAARASPAVQVRLAIPTFTALALAPQRLAKWGQSAGRSAPAGSSDLQVASEAHTRPRLSAAVADDFGMNAACVSIEAMV